jgi:hypothetical protein
MSRLADDPDVQAAVRAAVEAGVSEAEIDEAFATATATPFDELTEPILSGRLLALAREYRTGLLGRAANAAWLTDRPARTVAGQSVVDDRPEGVSVAAARKSLTASFPKFWSQPSDLLDDAAVDHVRLSLDHPHRTQEAPVGAAVRLERRERGRDLAVRELPRGDTLLPVAANGVGAEMGLVARRDGLRFARKGGGGTVGVTVFAASCE